MNTEHHMPVRRRADGTIDTPFYADRAADLRSRMVHVLLWRARKWLVAMWAAPSRSLSRHGARQRQPDPSLTFIP